MSSYGFRFKDKHSYTDYGLIMRSKDRSLLPATKRRQINLDFLDGKIDLQKEPVYDNRIISVQLVYRFNTLQEMHAKKRQMAAWLSGLDKLVFDDEPDKYYEAKVFDAISIEQSLKRMVVQVDFECSPFALNNQQMQVNTITEQGQKFNITIAGNIKTCGKLIITNIGDSVINSLTLRRERTK